MLTLGQLLKLTPRSVRARAVRPIFSRIRDRVIDKFTTHHHRLHFTRVGLYNPDSSGRAYQLIIKNYGTKKAPKNYKFVEDSHLWVHCSCPYFTYYLEVALTLRKSSAIYDSNGELPRIRNPRLRPYLCKHLFAALVTLAKNDAKKG